MDQFDEAALYEDPAVCPIAKSLGVLVVMAEWKSGEMLLGWF
jgi:hypothetical protein